MSVNERTGSFSVESQALHSDLPLSPEFLEEWNDYGYKIEFYGRDPRVLLFGQSHYRPGHVRSQLDFMHYFVKPECVLYEDVRAWTFDPRFGIWYPQPGRKFSEIDQIRTHLDFEEEFMSLGIEIIGCDLTNAECVEIGKKLCQVFPEEYDYDETMNQIRKMTRPSYGTGFEGSYLPLNEHQLATDGFIERFRDGHMVKMIARYQKKSRRPIVVILGADHTRRIIQNGALRRRRIGYAYVDQYHV